MAKKRMLLSLDDHISLLDRFDDNEQDFKDTIYERIKERTEFDPETECVVYTGSWEPSGQAKIRVGAHIYCITRVTAWLYIPGFKLWSVQRAVRTCDTPACCNPEHVVVVADQAEAMGHQREYGKIGNTHGRLCSAKKAEDIRRRHKAGASIEQLMEETGMRRSGLREVILGRTWAPKK